MGKRAVRVVDERFLGLLEVRRLLKQSFPREERMPFPLMLVRAKMKDFEILAYYDGGDLCAVSVTCSDKYVCSIQYLAVAPKLQDRGIGTSVLKYLSKRHRGKVMTVDIEVPYADAENIAQRMKRLRFYEKNGFVNSHRGYTCHEVDYLVLTKNGEFNEPLLHSVYDKAFLGLFRPEFREM